MKYKVYLRDWYYNAGIIGFLNVLSKGQINIEDIRNQFNDKIKIGENFIEFDTEILNGFYENYELMAFDIFFDIDNYKERINNLIKKIENPNQKITQKLLQETALNGKIVNKFIKEIYNKNLKEIFSGNNILNEVNEVKSKLDSLIGNNDTYTKLKGKNSDFINYFLENEVARRICSYKNISEYVQKLLTEEIETNNNNQRCYSCSQYKKSYDLSNAISQVLGFNSDNSNWIWGFKGSKVQICPLCALIYSCALHGMVFLNRKVENDYKTFFYALNRNTDVSTLYGSFWNFKKEIEKKENQNKPFYTIMIEVVLQLIKQRAQSFLENVNFIEISESDFGGQSTKSYKVYNYNITPELARFIYELNEDELPKGNYIEKENFFDITEKILKKTLDFTLGYDDLFIYFKYYIMSFTPKSNVKVYYSTYKIMRYILKYINRIKGGNFMEQEKIVNKGFYNGKEMAKKIGQENKIKGIAYQLLNDLKISDRNSFVDKYLRMCMSYSSEVKLGSNNELVDLDSFMSFGYAFVNGLLSQINIGNNEEVENG